MVELITKAVLSYLLGSIVGGLLVGRLRGGVDIRRMGSGNAGGTNALRTQGKAFAFWVMLIDIGKGWVATKVLAPLVAPGLFYAVDVEGIAALCGFAVILGHVYPVWYGFRGGKGVATLVGAVLGLDAWLLVPMLATWLLAVILFGFVGLASILGALALAVETFGRGSSLMAFGIMTALLITFTHRSNISRMLGGREPRARRLWLLGLRRGGA
jgi:acyl phosphate:glycerol-3-phosphate acyltransferase